MLPALGPELSVVIPAYNTGAFIAKSLATVSSYLSRRDASFEIVVVDDGSTDDTHERLHSLATAGVRPLSVFPNQGKGAAIKHGILAAAGPFIVITDADIPYGPEAISHCHSALRRGAVLVVGDRTLPESREVSRVPAGRRFLSQAYSALLRPLVSPSGLRDTQCGLKGFQAEFAAQLVAKSRVNRFAFDVEVIVFAIQNRIASNGSRSTSSITTCLPFAPYGIRSRCFGTFFESLVASGRTATASSRARSSKARSMRQPASHARMTVGRSRLRAPPRASYRSGLDEVRRRGCSPAIR